MKSITFGGKYMASLLEQVKEQEAIREDIKIEQKKRKKAVAKIISIT